MHARAVVWISLIVILVVSAGSSAGTVSGLRGKVTLYPARPVCAEDDSCTKPAPGVLLLFKREGRAAGKVTTRRDSTYRVFLAPGRYVVVAPRYRVGSGVTPRTVRVFKGRIARVDLQIDTGIQ